MDRRIYAATQLVLIFPAALFLTAVVARHLPYEPAHLAQEIVTWYSVRFWTLWVLLLGLPFAALLNGCLVLLRSSNDGEGPFDRTQRPMASSNSGPFAAIRTQRPMQIIAAATFAAGLILVVVILHMLAN